MQKGIKTPLAEDEILRHEMAISSRCSTDLNLAKLTLPVLPAAGVLSPPRDSSLINSYLDELIGAVWNDLGRTCEVDSMACVK